MTQEAEQFWRDFEKSTGERVEAKTMGQWLDSSSQKEGVWGLLILTDRSLRFMGRKTGSWFSNLFKSPTRSEDKEVTLVVPRGGLLSLAEPKRGGMGRFWGPAFPRVRVSWGTCGETVPGDAIFEVDDHDGFLAVLRNALPG